MQQMREAFPWDATPRYVLRDRDAIYGRDYAAMIRRMGMTGSTYCSAIPLAKSVCGTTGGSIRRECLDHVIVWNERSLRRTLHNYFAYYLVVTYAFGLGQRRPGVQGSGTTGTGARGSDSTGRGTTTTDISDAPLSRSKAVASTFAFLSGNAASP